MVDKEPTSRKVLQADAGVRAQRAWSARVAGSTWEEAALVAGFADGTGACRAVKVYFGTLPTVSREEARSLWRQRHEKLWAIANRDAEDGRPGALRAGVAVARSAAQLDALDTPTVSVVVTPSAADMERAIEMLSAACSTEQSWEEGDVFADVEE